MSNKFLYISKKKYSEVESISLYFSKQLALNSLFSFRRIVVIIDPLLAYPNQRSVKPLLENWLPKFYLLAFISVF